MNPQTFRDIEDKKITENKFSVSFKTKSFEDFCPFNSNEIESNNNDLIYLKEKQNK